MVSVGRLRPGQFGRGERLNLNRDVTHLFSCKTATPGMMDSLQSRQDGFIKSRDFFAGHASSDTGFSAFLERGTTQEPL